jgi:hypothetical protein
MPSSSSSLTRSVALDPRSTLPLNNEKNVDADEMMGIRFDFSSQGVTESLKRVCRYWMSPIQFPDSHPSNNTERNKNVTTTFEFETWHWHFFQPLRLLSPGLVFQSLIYSSSTPRSVAQYENTTVRKHLSSSIFHLLLPLFRRIFISTFSHILEGALLGLLASLFAALYQCNGIEYTSYYTYYFETYLPVMMRRGAWMGAASRGVEVVLWSAVWVVGWWIYC